MHVTCQVIRPHFVFRFELRAWAHFVWKFTVFGSCPQKAHGFLSTLTAAGYQWDKTLAFILLAQGVEAFTVWHSADLSWHQTLGSILQKQFCFVYSSCSWVHDQSGCAVETRLKGSTEIAGHDHILLTGMITFCSVGEKREEWTVVKADGVPPKRSLSRFYWNCLAWSEITQRLRSQNFL